jgi:hypothetical protein
MAGRSEDGESENDGPVELEQVKQSLRRHQGKLFRATEGNSGSIEDARAVAVLQEQVWNLRALVLQLEDDDDAAAKAAREACRFGELAVKLAKSTLADRVLALEQAVDEGRSKGRRIKQEAARRRALKQESK